MDGIKIANPRLAVEAAVRAKLPIPLALALLSKESSGGRNEWGHDRGTIFAGGVDKLHNKSWGETVTRAAYLAYRAERNATGEQQGVGPTQLTFSGYQKAADKLGGAWRPLPNMLEGFTVLRQNVQRQGLFLGVALYNGKLSAETSAYSHDVLRLERAWAASLGLSSMQGL